VDIVAGSGEARHPIFGRRCDSRQPPIVDREIEFGYDEACFDLDKVISDPGRATRSTSLVSV